MKKMSRVNLSLFTKKDCGSPKAPVEYPLPRTAIEHCK